MATPDLHVFSLNARGIRSKKKRMQLFQWCKRMKFDVICIQESYVTVEVADTWKLEWGGELHFCEGTAHSGGQLILIRKGLDCIINVEVCCKQILAISLKYNNEDIIIVNVYAPQVVKEKLIFFNRLQNIVDNFTIKNICVTGDFNSVLDNKLDIISGDNHPEVVVTRFNGFIDHCDLIDSWRMFNPEHKEYVVARISFYS